MLTNLHFQSAICLCSARAALPWTSGTVYSKADAAAADEARAMEEAGEAKRLRAMKDNDTLPLLFFDVKVRQGIHQFASNRQALNCTHVGAWCCAAA